MSAYPNKTSSLGAWAGAKPIASAKARMSFPYWSMQGMWPDGRKYSVPISMIRRFWGMWSREDLEWCLKTDARGMGWTQERARTKDTQTTTITQPQGCIERKYKDQPLQN
jgi:hypothetical protein